MRKVYLKGAAAFAAVAALLAIATVLQGDFGETEGKIFPTIAATFVAGGCISVVARPYGRQACRPDRRRRGAAGGRRVGPPAPVLTTKPGSGHG
jgi:hypothetical protein